MNQFRRATLAKSPATLVTFAHMQFARGMTLVEMVVVIAVLAALAGLAVPLFTGSADLARFRATQTTLGTVRDATTAYLADTGLTPSQLADLLRRPSFADPTLNDYHPATRRGWHGPYISLATGVYRVDAAVGFTASYGAVDDPALLDGWSRPIVIQTPTNPLFIRAVSAGPDGILTTPASVNEPTAAECGDDLVLFLRQAVNATRHFIDANGTPIP